jgi:hypothetical protein
MDYVLIKSVHQVAVALFSVGFARGAASQTGRAAQEPAIRGGA